MAIERGKKADINVIDMDALTLHPAAMAYDLPAGGNRILQGASGYAATIVSGTVTRRNDVDTGRVPAGWCAERDRPPHDDRRQPGAHPRRRRDRHPSACPTLVPAERYYSLAFAQLEIERMWPKVWQVACMVDHVAEPGDYFEYRCGPYGVLIVRGDDGVCAHSRMRAGIAATRCAWARVQDCASSMRLPRLDLGPGRHTETGAQPQGLRRRCVCPTSLWCRPGSTAGEGLVFVNLDLDAMPLLEYLEAVPDDIAWCNLGDFRCYATLTVDVDANWKTIADGYSETYHIQTLHPELLRCVDDIHAPQQIWGHTGKSDQPYGVQSPRFEGALSDEEVWDAYVYTQGALMGAAEGTPFPERSPDRRCRT